MRLGTLRRSLSFASMSARCRLQPDSQCADSASAAGSGGPGDPRAVPTAGDFSDILRALADGVGDPAYERVTTVLRRALTLRLFPGDRLPPERILAKSLGVSRITVRQAVAKLQDEGMASPGASRRAGTLSGPLRRSDNAELRRAFPSDIRDILEFRSILETAAARLAAVRHEAHLIERLRASIDANRKAPDASEFRRSDTEFHLALAQASGNQRLMGAILTARAEFLRWRDLHPMPDNVTENVRDHELILETIRAHDEEGAASAMREHLQGTLHVFLVSVQGTAATSGAGNSGGPTRSDGPF